ncbi:hypothetical protein INR49_025729, partial [Caranx melampygus]
YKPQLDEVVDAYYCRLRFYSLSNLSLSLEQDGHTELHGRIQKTPAVPWKSWILVSHHDVLQPVGGSSENNRCSLCVCVWVCVVCTTHISQMLSYSYSCI